MTPVTNAPIDRDRAVKALAAHIGDRDAYVVTAAPYALQPLSQRLREVPTWNAYLDVGGPRVMWTDKADVLLVTGLLAQAASVLVVPKTVPPAVLSQAVGQDIADDGSQDLVVLRHPTGPLLWPMLFVDALEIVDPRAAAELRANHIPNLN